MAGGLGRWAWFGVSRAPQPPSYPAALLPLLFSLALAACGAATTDALSIRLTESAIEVTGLSSASLDALGNAALSDEQWQSIFRVAVADDAPAMLGAYALDGDIVRFTPAFPLDAGRQYQASFDPSRIPGRPAAAPIVRATLGRPAEVREPTTVVTHVYPSGDEIPENVLRMYVEFSAPMGRKSGVEHITLLNHDGREIPGAVLPLDYEFWSPDHRRFTVFFDPGRVKQGILPNREMGRAFTPGQTVTLAIRREWLDEHGQPLKEDYRRTFRVREADEAPLDPARWTVAAPPRAGRAPLTVTFPEPLDHGLLMRALGVRRNGEPVEGNAEVDANETRWRFTPRDAWEPGGYQLLVLDILEDLAGNQIGRAFEVDNFDTVDKSPDPQTITLPFAVD
jgi:hypothetical protein